MVDMLIRRDRLMEMYREQIAQLEAMIAAPGPQDRPVDVERAQDAVAFGRHTLTVFEVDAFVTVEGLSLAEAGMYFMTMGGWVHRDHVTSLIFRDAGYAALERGFLHKVDGGYALTLRPTASR